MKQGEMWFGQFKEIDTPTFIYEKLAPMVDHPYGRTPMQTLLTILSRQKGSTEILQIPLPYWLIGDKNRTMTHFFLSDAAESLYNDVD
jgi:hypothetical protein